MNNNIDIKRNGIDFIDSDTESNSDYIDLSEYATLESKNIYQFHINNDKLTLNCIGKSSHTADMIIKENFGPELNLSLYNCIFAHDELELFESDNLFFPLIKLINLDKKNDSHKIITSLAVKINQELKYDNEIIEWELYYIEDDNLDSNIRTNILEKNISSENIVEKIIEYSIQ